MILRAVAASAAPYLRMRGAAFVSVLAPGFAAAHSTNSNLNAYNFIACLVAAA